jgi:hypothetical protein
MLICQVGQSNRHFQAQHQKLSFPNCLLNMCMYFLHQRHLKFKQPCYSLPLLKKLNYTAFLDGSSHPKLKPNEGPNRIS